MRMPDEKENVTVSPIQLSDLEELKRPDGARARVPDGIFEAILKETGGKAALVIALKNPLRGGDGQIPQPIHGFHISAVNVEIGFLPSALHVIAEALLGRLGGEIIIKSRPSSDKHGTV